MMYLAREEILSYNRSLISLFGGTYFQASDNVRNINSFEFLLDAPKWDLFYPDTFTKAAVYLFLIIKDHIFNDGNKRTAMMAAFLFLERNGTKVQTNPRRIVRYAKNIAGCRPSIQTISRWLRNISVS